MSTENVCCVGRGAIHQSRCFSALALSGNSKCLQMFTKARSSSKLTPTLMPTPLVLKATHARAQDPTGAHQPEAVLFRSCRLLAPAASALATTDCLITANPKQRVLLHAAPGQTMMALASFSETFRCFWAAQLCSSLSS